MEEGKKLSESVLWQLQRDLYDSRGIQSWAHGNVPQTITTTPFIARAYAKVVLGFLRDMAIWRDMDPSAEQANEMRATILTALH